MKRPDDLVDELADYFDFLKGHLPFSDLSPTDLVRVVRALEVSYHRSGSRVFTVGDHIKCLYVVRKGAVEVAGEDGVLIAREGEGDCFGFPALLTGGVARREALCVEDTLVYAIPEALFQDLRRREPKFDRFFGVAHESRLRSVLEEESSGGESLLAQPIRSLVRRDPVFIEPTATVRQAAERMAEHRIASVLVGNPSRMVGIVTDRDLRCRVLAQGLDGSALVQSIMTERPYTIDADARSLEALLTMTRHRVHHLPVDEHGRVIGVISATDLLRLQAAHPVYMVSDIHKQTSLEGLAAASRRLPGVVQRLAQADLRASEVGRVITFVADAITERLISLAQQEIGPAPARFAWVGLGSQARSELGLNSDQDNALVLEPGAEAHDAWFERLAEHVTRGLAACGFPPCPGDVMATNPTWRKNSADWGRYFTHWIETPDPRALLNASVYFDMRTVVGDEQLVSGVRGRMLEMAKRNQRFLACMARAALEHRPPIGFFRQFVLDKGGAEGKALDLKHRGIAPIVGLARVHALAVGSPEVETRARIEDAKDKGGMSAADAASLLDAHAFIAQVRLRHQANQLTQGIRPDNFVSPEALSSFERAHLKDAFKVVESLQSGLEYRFKTGMLG